MTDLLASTSFEVRIPVFVHSELTAPKIRKRFGSAVRRAMYQWTGCSCAEHGCIDSRWSRSTC